MFIQSRLGAVDFSRHSKVDELIGIVNEEEAYSIMKFIATSRVSKENCVHTYSLPSLEDKDRRRQLHLFFKMNFPFVSSKTEGQSIILSIRPVCSANWIDE